MHLICFIINTNCDVCEVGKLKSLVYLKHSKYEFNKKFQIVDEKFNTLPLTIIDSEIKKIKLMVDISPDRDDRQDQFITPTTQLYSSHLKIRNSFNYIASAYRHDSNIFSMNVAPSKNDKSNNNYPLYKYKIIQMNDEDVLSVDEFQPTFENPIYHLIVIKPKGPFALITYYVEEIEKKAKFVFVYNSATKVKKKVSSLDEFLERDFLDVPRYKFMDESGVDEIDISMNPMTEEKNRNTDNLQIKGLCPLAKRESYKFTQPQTHYPYGLVYEKQTSKYNERFNFLIEGEEKTKFSKVKINFTKSNNSSNTNQYETKCKIVKWSNDQLELLHSMFRRKKYGKTFTSISFSPDSYYVVEKRDDYTENEPYVRLGKVILFFGKDVTKQFINKVTQHQVFSLNLYFPDRIDRYSYYFIYDSYQRVELEKPDGSIIQLGSLTEYEKVSHLLPFFIIPINEINGIVIYSNGSFSVNSLERAFRLDNPLFIAEPIIYFGLDSCDEYGDRIFLPQDTRVIDIDFLMKTNSAYYLTKFFDTFCILIIILIQRITNY